MIASEIDILMIGTGGQGVQLIGKTLALAATISGANAMLAAEFGGEMRGGPSQSSVVIGAAKLRALPVLPSAGWAVVMHDRFAAPVFERLRPDSLVMINSSVVENGPALSGHRIVEVPVTDLAREAGAPQTAGFIMLGAFNQLVEAVPLRSLEDAMRSLLPPYRAQHAEANITALRTGSEFARSAVPA